MHAPSSTNKRQVEKKNGCSSAELLLLKCKTPDLDRLLLWSEHQLSSFFGLHLQAFSDWMCFVVLGCAHRGVKRSSITVPVPAMLISDFPSLITYL